MCGRNGESVKARIEGAILRVCDSCARCGTVVEFLNKPAASPLKQKRFDGVSQAVPMYENEIVDDYSSLIKRARERCGLTHKEIGAKISERESVISKIESGAMKLDMNTAKKFERTLNIKLIEKREVCR